MKILMNTGGLASTNCYVVACKESKQAVLFDAPNDTTAPLLEEVRKQGWDLVGLWLTHAHFDHYADHAVVTRAFPHAKVLLHRDDEPRIMGEIPTAFPLPFTIPPRQPDGYLEEGQILQLGKLSCRVLHTPGHCPGHVTFFFEREKFMISGDLIICGGIGRTDLPGGSYDVLCQSIRRIAKVVPRDTQLLPGHCHSSTLGDELENNPHVQEALGSGGD
jgi:hydroxyacylglutathione hydrolase